MIHQNNTGRYVNKVDLNKSSDRYHQNNTDRYVIKVDLN